MIAMIRLAAASLWNRRVAAALTIVCIALSVALLLSVEKLRRDGRDAFANTISGTDLIVGARGGAVQLLLYSVFRIGNATNTVSWASYEAWQKDKRIAWTVPISLGDMHRGFRVMGTNESYFEHYRYARRQQLQFAAGTRFRKPLDAVLGATVAREFNYRLGDTLTMSHGGGEINLIQHEDHPFRVVGILALTGTPVDRTIHVSLRGIEQMHEGWENGRPPTGLALPDLTKKHDHEEHHPETITAFLAGVKQKSALLGLQRDISTYQPEALQAIIPGVALQELWDLLGIFESVLRVISWLVVATGLLGMLTVLLATLEARRREMAVLRAVGARPAYVAGLFIAEACVLACAGVVVGVGLFLVATWLAQPVLSEQFGLYLPVTWLTGSDLLLLAGVVLAAFVAGAIPAARAMRQSLADGLSVRL